MIFIFVCFRRLECEKGKRDVGEDGEEKCAHVFTQQSLLLSDVRSTNDKRRAPMTSVNSNPVFCTLAASCDVFCCHVLRRASSLVVCCNLNPLKAAASFQQRLQNALHDGKLHTIVEQIYTGLRQKEKVRTNVWASPLNPKLMLRLKWSRYPWRSLYNVYMSCLAAVVSWVLVDFITHIPAGGPLTPCNVPLHVTVTANNAGRPE